jgi:hypothetical protein
MMKAGLIIRKNIGSKSDLAELTVSNYKFSLKGIDNFSAGLSQYVRVAIATSMAMKLTVTTSNPTSDDITLALMGCIRAKVKNLRTNNNEVYLLTQWPLK